MLYYTTHDFPLYSTIYETQPKDADNIAPSLPPPNKKNTSTTFFMLLSKFIIENIW